MPLSEIAAAISRFQAATDALAAIGTRLRSDADVPGEVRGAIDDVLAAAGVNGIDDLEPPQRAMLAGVVRTAFAQATDLLVRPERAPGWVYTDPTLLEGQGRGSMIVPTLLAQFPELANVASLLDIGTGVGLLAVSAAAVWPECTVVGVDVWEPSLELARANVTGAGLQDRITIRAQNVLELDDVDRYDCVWLPTFFFAEEVLTAALPRVVAASRPGGWVVAGHYDAPPDPLAKATMRLRTVRDGGSVLDADGAARALSAAGLTDVRPLPRAWPVPIGFVIGTKGSV